MAHGDHRRLPSCHPSPAIESVDAGAVDRDACTGGWRHVRDVHRPRRARAAPGAVQGCEPAGERDDCEGGWFQPLHGATGVARAAGERRLRGGGSGRAGARDARGDRGPGDDRGSPHLAWATRDARGDPDSRSFVRARRRTCRIGRSHAHLGADLVGEVQSRSVDRGAAHPRLGRADRDRRRPAGRLPVPLRECQGLAAHRLLRAATGARAPRRPGDGLRTVESPGSRRRRAARGRDLSSRGRVASTRRTRPAAANSLRRGPLRGPRRHCDVGWRRPGVSRAVPERNEPDADAVLGAPPRVRRLLGAWCVPIAVGARGRR